LRTAGVHQTKARPWSWPGPWKRQAQRQARRPQHLLLVLLLLLQERLCKHSCGIHTSRESTWLQARQPSSSIAKAAQSCEPWKPAVASSCCCRLLLLLLPIELVGKQAAQRWRQRSRLLLLLLHLLLCCLKLCLCLLLRLRLLLLRLLDSWCNLRIRQHLLLQVQHRLQRQLRQDSTAVHACSGATADSYKLLEAVELLLLLHLQLLLRLLLLQLQQQGMR
jgi:hypothetical protein